MNVFFFGIFDIGTAALRRLLEAGIHVSGIVTKPQEGAHLQAFREIAGRHRIPLFTPGPGEDGVMARRIRLYHPDLIVVSGYHRLIPPWLLELAPQGGINLHPSLLPRHRGPCPWKWAIVKGERRTGITVHAMTGRFDSGRILAQEEVAIGDDETGGELFQRLADIGSRLLVKVVAAMARGPVASWVQDERDASYFGTPTDLDARIDWSAGATQIRDLVRGFHPRPGAWTTSEKARVRIGRIDILETVSLRPPGTIVGLREDGVLVSTGTRVVAVHVLNSPGAEALPLRPAMMLGNSRAEASPYIG